MKVFLFILPCLILSPYIAGSQTITNSGEGKQAALDSLIANSYFKAGNKAGAEEALLNAHKAKQLAAALTEAGYAKALELEGTALVQLGQATAGIDSLAKAVARYEALADPALLAEGHYALGNAYEQQQEYGLALVHLKTAKDLYQDRQDTVRTGLIINNLANIYFHTGKYDDALNYYFTAVALKQQANDQAGLARSYANIALVYKNIGNQHKALDYNLKAIALQRQEKDSFNLSISLLNAGNIYRKLQHYDSALAYHHQALTLSRQLNDSIGIGLAYFSMGNVALVQDNLPEANRYFKDALIVFEQLQIISYRVQTYANRATTYLKMGKLANARAAALKGLQLLDGVEVKTTHQSLVETLYKIYKQQGDYNQALHYHELFMAYTDSLLDAAKLRKLTRLETDFQIKQKDQEIALLNKTRELNRLQIQEAKTTRLFLVILLALIVVVAITLYNRYRLKTKAEALLAAKNRELAELNAAKDKFFAIIAHDLRNPLSAFKSLSATLSENFSRFSEEEIKDYLENLKSSSTQLIDLLQNLLQWALVQTQRLKHYASIINLNDLLQKNLALLVQSAREKNITLKARLLDESHVYADAATVDLVFRNLIANAIKFTGPGGEVSVVTRQGENGIEVAIVDTGIGMTEADTKKLFDITQDPASIGDAVNKGTGLGLILCKEFVALNNGSIKVQSQPGKGSTFVVVLPDKQLKPAA